ncbi:MAG: hypothetical protein ACC661_10970, partial [Verrucomicrobiales bacterium]
MAWVLGFLCVPSLQAIIVAGANGGSDTSNNTDAASLDAYLASVSDPSFLYWDNTVKFTNGSSRATAIYLGGTGGWVLTANHVTLAPTITFLGTAYTVDIASVTQIDGIDLKVFQITHVTEALPALPDVLLDAVTPAIGSNALMIAVGQDRTEIASTDADLSDAVAVGDFT